MVIEGDKTSVNLLIHIAMELKYHERNLMKGRK